MHDREAGAGPPGLIRTIPVEQIRPGAHQARRQIDTDTLAELAASIREHGILQPVLVRPQGDWFELVAGERRWRAAQAAGVSHIPAVVREMSERDAAIAGLVENLQREDLPFFEEAEGYRQLIEEFRISQEELAGQIGRSQPTVANKIRLLRLEPAVRQAVAAAGLGERHARALLRLDGEQERLRAVAVFARDGLSAQQAEAWVARQVDRPAAEAPSPVDARDEEVRRSLDVVGRVGRRLQAAGFPAEITHEEDESGWTVHLRIGRRQGEPAAKRRRA